MNPPRNNPKPLTYLDNIYAQIANLPPAARIPAKTDWDIHIAAMVFCVGLVMATVGALNLVAQHNWNRSATILSTEDNYLLVIVSSVVAFVSGVFFFSTSWTPSTENPVNVERRTTLVSLNTLALLQDYLPKFGYQVSDRDQADVVFRQFHEVRSTLKNLHYELRTYSHHLQQDLEDLAFKENRVVSANALINSYYEWHKYALDGLARHYVVQGNTRGYIAEVPREGQNVSEAVDGSVS